MDFTFDSRIWASDEGTGGSILFWLDGVTGLTWEDWWIELNVSDFFGVWITEDMEAFGVFIRESSFSIGWGLSGEDSRISSSSTLIT